MKMIRQLASLVLAVFCIGSACGSEQVVNPGTVPALRNWTAAGGQLELTGDVPIIIETESGQPMTGLLSLADVLIADLFNITGLKARVAVSSESANARGAIVLHLGKFQDDPGNEGYILDINESVHIRASSVDGLFYGVQTVLQWLKQSGKSRLVPTGRVIDYPRFQQRGIMLDVGRKYYEISYLEQLIRSLAWQKMNTLHLHFTEWLAFRLESDTYPGLAAAESYSKEDIRYLQDVAKRYHVDIIPEIDLPAHATAMTEYEPRLAFKCNSMRKAKWQKVEYGDHVPAWTIDITREENRQWIAKLLDEFIPLFDSQYFHIGGDEYQYDPQKYECPELVEAMKEKGFAKPGDIFVEWVNETNEQVKSYGKTTQIWNWWRFLENDTTIQPAKDIIINVWNLPRQEEIIADGYKVVLTPESLLYVSPGLEDQETGYGIFDVRKIYEEWNTGSSEAILGYKLSVWSDEATHRTDQWFEGKSYEPRAVVAEKNWGRNGSKSVEGFLSRLNKVGIAPPVFPASGKPK